LLLSWNQTGSTPLARVDPFFGNVASSVNQGVETIMDKRIAGLLGAVSALAALNGAQAATAPADPAAVLKAQSYADLLSPIPNAKATLNAVDEASDQAGTSFQVAENSHHHHHHSYRRERRIIVAPRRHHHHHHHHHSMKIEMH
jgi:hypothetical protein